MRIIDLESSDDDIVVVARHTRIPPAKSPGLKRAHATMKSPGEHGSTSTRIASPPWKMSPNNNIRRRLPQQAPLADDIIDSSDDDRTPKLARLADDIETFTSTAQASPAQIATPPNVRFSGSLQHGGSAASNATAERVPAKRLSVLSWNDLPTQATRASTVHSKMGLSKEATGCQPATRYTAGDQPTRTVAPHQDGSIVPATEPIAPLGQTSGNHGTVVSNATHPRTAVGQNQRSVPDHTCTIAGARSENAVERECQPDRVPNVGPVSHSNLSHDADAVGGDSTAVPVSRARDWIEPPIETAVLYDAPPSSDIRASRHAAKLGSNLPANFPPQQPSVHGNNPPPTVAPQISAACGSNLPGKLLPQHSSNISPQQAPASNLPTNSISAQMDPAVGSNHAAKLLGSKPTNFAPQQVPTSGDPRALGNSALPALATMSAQNEVAHNQPPVAPNQPTAMHNQPTAIHNRPTATQNQPAAAHNQPAVAQNQPARARNQPAVAHNQPTAIHNQPTAVHNEPTSIHNQPAASRNQPAVAHNQPAVAHNQSAVAHNQPPATRNQPAVVHNQPTGAVENFHRSSRLHFLGTWRERFDKWQHSLGEPPQLDPSDERLSDMYAYCDMDCFFVSVATRDFPDNVLPACVVSGMSDYSEVCSANYPARALGIGTRWVGEARRLCPGLRLFPVTPALLQLVEQIWKQVYLLMRDMSPLVDMRSCDEAVCGIPIDVTPQDWADKLRAEVLSATRCPISVGIAHTQILARLASKRAKKGNGVFILQPADVVGFLTPLTIDNIPGVGTKTVQKMAAQGVVTCGDVARKGPSWMFAQFGQTGAVIYAQACGKDPPKKAVGQGAATVSSEMNWGLRPKTVQDVRSLLSQVVQDLRRRMEGRPLQVTKANVRLKIAPVGWTEPSKSGGHGRCVDINVWRAASMETDALLLLDEALTKGQQVPNAGDGARWTKDEVATRVRGVGVTVCAEKGVRKRWKQRSIMEFL